MNRLFYNGGLAAGALLASIGAGIQWGTGVGLMVGGGLLIALTLYGAHMIREVE
ncbi:MAG: hypothetical protein AB7O64_17210 [Methylibium sp.]